MRRGLTRIVPFRRNTRATLARLDDAFGYVPLEAFLYQPEHSLIDQAAATFLESGNSTYIGSAGLTTKLRSAVSARMRRQAS